jgi:hypothetical protein
MCVPNEQTKKYRIREGALSADRTPVEPPPPTRLVPLDRSEEQEQRLYLEAKLWDRYGQGRLW